MVCGNGDGRGDVMERIGVNASTGQQGFAHRTCTDAR